MHAEPTIAPTSALMLAIAFGLRPYRKPQNAGGHCSCLVITAHDVEYKEVCIQEHNNRPELTG